MRFSKYDFESFKLWNDEAIIRALQEVEIESSVVWKSVVDDLLSWNN